jgi:archaellum component FlaC
MTIDERIEKLTERHEALAQAVELMGQITGQRINDVITAINKDAENIRALVRIAEMHEHRLTDLEGQA